MRRRRSFPRLRPMPGRGRHGAYTLAGYGDTATALVSIAWGLLLHPFETTEPDLWRYDA